MCFFFNDTATTEIYTLSLHDALPISEHPAKGDGRGHAGAKHEDLGGIREAKPRRDPQRRSEEHTSELQSQFRISYAVFCLKKKI